jgi:hypothetical protein
MKPGERKLKEFGQMGDKHFSITDLKRSKVMLYSSARKRLTCHPTMVVSPRIRTILLDYILHKRWNIHDYQKLEGDDKRDLDRLLHITGMEYDLGVETDTSSDDIKRFNLLKGEILAGNDSKEVIRELQMIVLRLTANRRIPKSTSGNLMYELVSILP